VLDQIEALDDLAPLHNAQSVAILRSCMATFGSLVPIVAVFDSAFHATLPEVAYRYPLEYDLAERHGIRRYGFHGISHKYLALRYSELRQIPLEQVNIITLHLGGGASATAIRGGKSVDTSMGFTPLEGLMMGTRCGDIDPSLVAYLARKESVGCDTVQHWLNKKSGLFGVSQVSQDTRVLAKTAGDRSHLALAMFAYRVRKYIGAYVAAMGGATAVIFAAGIGENSPNVRGPICEGLECLGLDLDPKLNAETIDREGCITRAGSRIEAWVIPTEEELMMARDAISACRG
jgi:acetate kinase